MSPFAFLNASRFFNGKGESIGTTSAATAVLFTLKEPHFKSVE